MHLHNAHLGKTIFWGCLTAVLYAVLFTNADLIQHLAHTTPDTCVVGHGATAAYFLPADNAACVAKGGHLAAGNRWNVALPILIAFAISFVHGAFTGLFWDVMGLKPAGKATALSLPTQSK